MSSAWLTPAERAGMVDPSRATIGVIVGNLVDVLNHAALADEIIEELADRLKAKTHVSDALGCDCVPCVIDRDLLKRVDELRNENG